MLKQQKWTGKKVVWQWTKKQEEASDTCKNVLIEQPKLHTPRQGNLFELKVTILDDKVSWGLWQSTGLKSQKKSVGFWSKALQGSAIHYNPMEKMN